VCIEISAGSEARETLDFTTCLHHPSLYKTRLSQQLNYSFNTYQDKIAMDLDLKGSDIVEMIMGYQTTQIMYAASSLGIFDELMSDSEGLPALKVAHQLGTNIDATERLMNACVGLRLMNKRTDSNGTAIYSNTKSTSQFLTNKSPFSMRPMLNKVGDLYPLWGRLSHGITEGRCQLSAALGVNSEYFDVGCGYYATETKQLEFLQVMHMFASMDAPSVLKAFDLSHFQSACDLGGGTGALSVKLASQNPDMLVTVFDLEHVLACTPHFLSTKPDNVILQAGDFFEDDLPPAELYILSHVIHDWGEEKIDVLLEKIYKSLKPGGALLILEKMLNESKDGPLNTLYFDMGMLIGSEGRERTCSEYMDTLERHGFTNIQTKVIPQSQFRDAILAHKA